MKQEYKELLLKDLCARLPYGVKISVNDRIETLEGVHVLDVVAEYGSGLSSDVKEVKPYLFPLSSMTEEQKQYLKNRFCYDWDGEPYELWKYQIEIGETDELIDWFHKNHLDYRNLIPMKLAIDATDKNIY
jgi:hypothetical protein